MAKINILYLLALPLLVACAKPASPSQSVPAALPAGWLVQSQDSGAPLSAPSPELITSVQAAFGAHSAALEMVYPTDSVTVATPGHPPGWVPWHLDGLIGSFAVDVGGIFGTLIADGSPSVKVTWQKQSAAPARKSASPVALRFHPNMSAGEVAAMLEPAVAAVGARGHLDLVRRRLNTEAGKFLAVVRVLDTVHSACTWRVDGYQLMFSVSASGNVTPELNVGGMVSIIFDWQATLASGAISFFAPPADTAGLGSLARSVAELLPQAVEGDAEIRAAGFELQVFQVGVAITAGGNFGIAAAQTSVAGRIIFKRTSSRCSSLGEQVAALTFVGDGSSASMVVAGRFRKGMRRALKMGAFFARQAVAADKPHWKATEVELGLDVAANGNIGMSTLGGSALIRLGFERVGN
jgi:hypothetical protein